MSANMPDILTVETVKKVMPLRAKPLITQDLINKVNSIKDPEIAKQVRDNFIGYCHVLGDGKYAVEDYLNAVIYVSYKLMGLNNQEAYIRTFPDRYSKLVAKGTSSKDFSAYVTAFARGKLVNLILEQTLVPTWVLNQDIYQKAINTQAELMVTAKSERIRCMAADSILTHLAKPEKAGPLINIDINQNAGLEELKQTLVKMAKTQQDLIQKGVATKEIAEQEIIDVEEANA